MKCKIPGNLSTFAGAILLAAAVAVAPLPSRAQSNTAPAVSTATPAQVVNQLLSMVEGDLVPLAEAMPADKYDFAPTNGNFKGVRTFGDQLGHVIRANYYMFGAAASIKPTEMPGMNDLKTKDQIVRALKNSFLFAHRSVDSLTPQNAMQTIKPVDGINTRAGVMMFAIIHMNDHFGQLIEYARMNGVTPPSSQPAKK